MDREGRRGLAVTPARVLWVLLALIAVILVAQNSNHTRFLGDFLRLVGC